MFMVRTVTTKIFQVFNSKLSPSTSLAIFLIIVKPHIVFIVIHDIVQYDIMQCYNGCTNCRVQFIAVVNCRNCMGDCAFMPNTNNI